jgi:hypothetical protein
METGSIAVTLASCNVIIQLLVQPLSRSRGKLESSSVTDELHYVTSAIQDGATVSTVLEVRGHCGSELGIHVVVKIV